jgi:hypothetical protein
MRRLTEEEAIAQFENGSLPNESFHHSDHVRMAYLYLTRFPVLDAIQRFSSALARFAAANGKPELYNETVTWAFLLLIRERMERAPQPQTWAEFIQANPELLVWKGGILQKYYRDETLASDLAKKVFLFPDKIADCT